MHLLTKIAISVVFVGLAAAHLIWPKASIDAIIVALALAATIPWLAPLLSSLELPGGIKMQFQQKLEKAEQSAEKVGLLAAAQTQTDEPTYISVAQEDPNLALAGLRIEIEKRLRQIAALVDPEMKPRGVGLLLRELHQREVLTLPQQSVLRKLVATLNDAVHGADVDQRAVGWVMDVGPRLVAALDEKLEELACS